MNGKYEFGTVLKPVTCALFDVAEGVVVACDCGALVDVLPVLNPVASTDPALIVPVHTALTGQQATWPA